MDMMALLNCSINFVIYCAMSRQFRTTFQKICNWKVHYNLFNFPFNFNIIRVYMFSNLICLFVSTSIVFLVTTYKKVPFFYTIRACNINTTHNRSIKAPPGCQIMGTKGLEPTMRWRPSLWGAPPPEPSLQALQERDVLQWLYWFLQTRSLQSPHTAGDCPALTTSQ